MNKKNVILVSVVFLSLVAGIILGNMLTTRAVLKSGNIELGAYSSFPGNKKVSEMLSIINSKYVDTIDVKTFTEELMADMVSKLDPHSIYIPASDLETVNSELEGSFSGIGVQFNIQNDTVMIISVVNGGPSEKVGLKAGDRIVLVNDTTFIGKSISTDKVMKKLRGPEDSKVKLSVRRNGAKELLKYTIVRGKIPVNSVDIAYMIEPGVGYIKINKFSATTYDEFMTGLEQLTKQGAKKFVIDLRENSGGLMDQAIDMVNEFLPAGELIVYSKGKAYQRYEAKSKGNGRYIKTPIVVLIDEFSASASEIFSGAIQDNDRGLIVGRRSFGKGLVQQQFDLRDGSALRLTVARYYTPSGRSIQKPYVKGRAEDYEQDILNRYLHGELDSKDSIHVADSLKFKTRKGRIVYGGGGIMPDIFVARDTTKYTRYLNQAVNKGLIYEFAFRYSDQHRAELSHYKTWKELSLYLDRQSLLTGFAAYATTKGLPADMKQLNISKQIIIGQIKAYISRNILGDNGFYPLLNADDKTVTKALEMIRKTKTASI
jgi:carboxyl-terminal processing protease